MNLMICDSSISSNSNSISVLNSTVKLDPKKELVPEIFNGHIQTFLSLKDFSATELVNRDWSERKIVEKVLEAEKSGKSLEKIIKHLISIFNLHVRDKVCYRLAEIYSQRDDTYTSDLFITFINNPTLKDNAHQLISKNYLHNENINAAKFYAKQIVNPLIKDKTLAHLSIEMAHSKLKKGCRLAVTINDSQIKNFVFAHLASIAIKNKDLEIAESCIKYITDPELHLKMEKKLYFNCLKKGKVKKSFAVLDKIVTDSLLK